ncbi:hypothetical protein QR680_001464 [Steinernema hermaphroditum]|nr:hypothetical protein QR680_001464 [Steinernema hermaphroditum]
MSGSVMNIHQYVNPDFDKYHQFVSQHCKHATNGRPGLGASQTQKVLSPSSNQLTERKFAKPDSYKTVMCQAWLESKACLFAENCRFAHGEEELRPIKTAPRQNNKYKTKLCDKYTTIGICPYGNRCLFIHPDPHKRAPSFPRSEQSADSFAQQNASQDFGFGAIGSRPSPPSSLESSNDGYSYDPFMTGADSLARRLAEIMDIWK